MMLWSFVCEVYILQIVQLIDELATVAVRILSQRSSASPPEGERASVSG